MALDRDLKYQEIAMRGKYRRLYVHLSVMPAREWRTTFSEIESILEFELPTSARLHRPWWANQGAGNGHSQSLAWGSAGWETAEVDMDAETLVLRPKKRPEPARRFNLDRDWPPHPTAVWPEGLSLRREDMYEDRI